MRRGLISSALAVIARTAQLLALTMPAPLQPPGWPQQDSTTARKPAGNRPAGSKLARMAREGRVGVSRIR